MCDFEVNQTKSKGGCQSGRKVVHQDSKSDLPLVGRGYTESFFLQLLLASSLLEFTLRVKVVLLDK